MLAEAFYDTYRNFLERYVCEGGAEGVLLEAYQDLTANLDDYYVQAANILDIHTRALREVMGIRRDSDPVQWIYIDRATEFLAQILVVIDTFLLQLKDRIEHDPLTGLYNRIAMYPIVNHLLKEAQEKGIPLVVAMLDLDDFKAVNDQFGHHAGDEVLRSAAFIIKKALRAADKVIRYGGEEFLVILPGTNLEKALIALERIRTQIASQQMVPGQDEVVVTISIGAVEYPGSGPADLNDLIEKADRAMYLAKRQGKNKVVCLDLNAPGI
ncbi:Adenylyl cyclase class-3/4/guanylyl cyclase [Moorella glycerini]|uniref:Diguanylate cyclase YedQ n=1 Tax=Neomoorella stamsii TaxID=1266720 RepID=A0A9X7J139_9FIRM|nr:MULTISPECIES: GGDEF domain-containing protein [Moorella]PRR69553.1 putative diguanylate cyclase YedQ [Moorella stamsii]CEP68793.1 Adenylyl cyclase class-3/4/guanylyl cyclase [Moorella glycerini]